MRNGFARRRVLYGIAATAVLPALASRALASGPDAPSDRVFRPPSGPMLYSRKVTRPLPGNASVIATRRFEVSFSRLEPGFLVRGQQVECKVEAPEALAALARLEENRVETGLFPLRLDEGGGITGGSALAPESGPELHAAIARVLSEIEQAGHHAEDELYMREFVAGIEQAANDIVAALPVQLFSPPETPLSQHSMVALPDGSSGEVSVTFAGQSDASFGLMKEASRTIETRLGESCRRTTEEWTLKRLT